MSCLCSVVDFQFSRDLTFLFGSRAQHRKTVSRLFLFQSSVHKHHQRDSRHLKTAGTRFAEQRGWTASCFPGNPSPISGARGRHEMGPRWIGRKSRRRASASRDHHGALDEGGEVHVDMKLSTLKPMLFIWIKEALDDLRVRGESQLRSSAWNRGTFCHTRFRQLILSCVRVDALSSRHLLSNSISLQCNVLLWPAMSLITRSSTLILVLNTLHTGNFYANQFSDAPQHLIGVKRIRADTISPATRT